MMSWYKMLMITAVLVFCSFITSCFPRELATAPPTEIPFLVSDHDNQQNILWYQGHINLLDGNIIINEEPVMVERVFDTRHSFEWDGHHHIYLANQEHVDSFSMLDKRSINFQKKPSDASVLYKYLGITEDRQLLLYLPKLSDQRNHSYVQFYGSKSQKLTLTPYFDGLPFIRFIRPVGIRFDDNEFEFYFHALDQQSNKLQWLLISAKYNEQSIEWKIITDRIDDSIMNTNTMMEYFHQKIYILDVSGEATVIDINTGTIKPFDPLTQLLQQNHSSFQHQEESKKTATFYRFGSLLIIKWQTISPASDTEQDHLDTLYVFIHHDEIIKTIHSSQNDVINNLIFPQHAGMNLKKTD